LKIIYYNLTFIEYIYYIYHRQSSVASTIAVPLFTQWLASVVLGKGMLSTKFVECPVVARVPARALVLYTAHWNRFI
jgi:hypothetical protein